MQRVIDLRQTNARLYGALLVGFATLLFSLTGYYTRLVELDLWTMIAWRSLFAAMTLLAFAVAKGGRAALDLRRRLGWPGLAYVPIAAASIISYIVALRLTTVANVMTIYATLPFVAAGIAYLLLRERIGRDVLVASGVAFAGVLVMAGSATGTGDIAGNVMALVMTVGFAASFVMARRWPGIDIPLAIALASVLCAVVCAIPAARILPDTGTLAQLFLFSLVSQSLGYMIFMAGGRHISGAESGLIALLDVVLGPLWVWLAFAERPDGAALVGGGIALGAVVWYLTRQLRGGGAR